MMHEHFISRPHETVIDINSVILGSGSDFECSLSTDGRA